MRLRTLMAAALLAAATNAGAAAELVASAVAPAGIEAAAADGLVARYGFAEMFAGFGDSLAAGPRLGGVDDARFLAAWEPAARTAFGGPALAGRVSAALGAALAPGDVATIEGFLDSPLGRRIGALERSAQSGPPDGRIALIAKGQTVWMTLPQARRDRLEEVLALTGSSLTVDILAQSMRGMAMGLHLANAGDLEVSWDEVDAEVDRQLAGMTATLRDANRAVAAFTYATLPDAELDAYLGFLRADPARRFYAAATLAVGAAVRDTMSALAETVAARLRRVGV
jgi:hypothetical protein